MPTRRIPIAIALNLLVGFTSFAELPPLAGHPDTKDWLNLFAADLSNAEYPKGVWSIEEGVLTASDDEAIWTDRDYDNFMLDLEFKNAPGTNSGVVVYCSDIKNWIPNSVEIQIADDHALEASEWPATWRCGAVFGHLAASKQGVVKNPGEWNRMTVRCVGPRIDVVLNGEPVVSMDLTRWISANKNPDGSEIPAWLSKPKSELDTEGRIGLQGKHGDAPIWFRNMKLMEIE